MTITTGSIENIIEATAQTLASGAPVGLSYREFKEHPWTVARDWLLRQPDETTQRVISRMRSLSAASC